MIVDFQDVYWGGVGVVECGKGVRYGDAGRLLEGVLVAGS